MMLLKYYFLIVIICFSLKNASAKEVYDVSADELFESMLGELYKVSHNFTIPTKFATYMKQNKTTRKYDTFTTKNPQLTSNNESFEAAMEYLNIKKNEMEIVELLNSGNNKIPDFHSDVDEIELITKRFDRIRMEFKETRRQDGQKLNREVVESYAMRIRNIMLQFIYETRYRLPYAQLLSKKYKDQIRYRIGYCFALLRNLKQQQLVLYSGLKTWRMKHFTDRTVSFDTQIYEKIVRLDVDIKDVIKLVKKMEYDRKMIENPTYYDDDFTEIKQVTGKVTGRGPMRLEGDGIIRNNKKFEEFYNRFRGEKRERLWNPSFGGLGPEGQRSRRFYSRKSGSFKYGDSENPPSEKSKLEDLDGLGSRRFGSADSESNMGSAGPSSKRVSTEDSKTSAASVSTATSKRSRYSRLWTAGFGL